MTDSEIVSQLFVRDESALKRAQEKYGSYGVAVSERILGNRQDAEECLNEALLDLWKSIPPHKPNNLKTYFGKLVREISVSKWRKEHAQKRFSGETEVSFHELSEIVVDTDFDGSVTENELARAISEFLRKLPDAERRAFIRRYWYCDSVKNICERFGYGESRVKMMLKRTRDSLKQYLEKEGYFI